MKSCGYEVGTPWTCKILTYGSDMFNQLFVIMKPNEQGGEATVLNWQVRALRG